MALDRGYDRMQVVDDLIIREPEHGDSELLESGISVVVAVDIMNGAVNLDREIHRARIEICDAL